MPLSRGPLCPVTHRPVAQKRAVTQEVLGTLITALRTCRKTNVSHPVYLPAAPENAQEGLRNALEQRSLLSAALLRSLSHVVIP